jgi:hypothetical protein
MLPTNEHFRNRLRIVEARLKQLERHGTGRVRAAAVEQLREEREILNLILLNRRVEGAKPVVNLDRWRSANGAVALVEPAREGQAVGIG